MPSPRISGLLPLIRFGPRSLLPGAQASFRMGRGSQRQALQASAGHGGLLILGSTRASRRGSRGIGLLVGVLQSGEGSDGASRALLQGVQRVQILGTERRRGVLWARVRAVREHGQASSREIERAQRLLARLAPAGNRRSPTLQRALELRGPTALASIEAAAGALGLLDRSELDILDELDRGKRIGLLNRCLRSRLRQAERPAPRRRASRAVRAIRAEVDAGSRRTARTPPVQELLERKLLDTPLPPEVRRHALRECEHARALPSGSTEAARLRHWMEWLVDLPWRRTSADPKGERAFQRVAHALDQSHTGLKEVKDRIIEFLAVRQLSARSRGTVLCFLGAPGVGKSSMARAVAVALGRRFAEISVAGLRGESELRGTPMRREDGGPGLVLQALTRSGALNPVVLIDDIDKLAAAAEGPSPAGAALLELLDGERNQCFTDRYLGLPFDLSRCLFLAAASDTSGIPPALLDRLEILEFPSYLESEKLAIARKHLLPLVRSRNGLRPSQLGVHESALRALVRDYTEEAGVRHVQRHLESLARKAALEVVRGGSGLSIRRRDLPALLGPRNTDEHLHLRRPAIGIANALAWTPAGGTHLPVEILAMPGGGRTILTGSIGDVLRESVQTSISYVRTRFDSLGLDSGLFDSIDLHFHFPSGSTPKDGPSAGLAIATALVSLLTRKPARHDVAMTGELSLHGEVLPVGGIREKLLAALRSGFRQAVVPRRNAEEVMRLPAEVRRALRVYLVQHVQEAFALVLLPSRGAARTRRPRLARER